MERLNYVTTLACVKASTAIDKAKDKLRTSVSEFKNDERGVEGFVVALILIAIAAVIAVAFKDELVKLINNLLKKIENIFNDDVSKDMSPDKSTGS